MIEWWNQVAATAMHGLQITVAGMLLVFLTLSLIIISMVLLTKLPWLQPRPEELPKGEAEPPAATVEALAPARTAEATEGDEELAQVAAMVMAMLHGQQLPVPTSGGLTRPSIRPTGGGGAWRSSGRAHQLGL